MKKSLSKRIKLILALVLCLPLLNGCIYRMLDWSVPKEGYSLVEDVAYGQHGRQTMDIYVPKQAKAGAPVLIFFYGGSWSNGEKSRYRFVGQAFASAGYTTVIPNYRVYPKNLFPDFIEDGAKAVSWLKDNNYADNGVVLAGHSAGAHIAAMLALDSSFLRDQNVDPDTLRAWIGMSGPYDKFKLSSKKLQKIFSNAEPPSSANPINFVSEDSPPALLIHGLDDRTVLAQHSKNLASELSALNVNVTTHYYPDIGHASVVAGIAEPLRGWSDTYKDTLYYLNTL